MKNIRKYIYYEQENVGKIKGIGFLPEDIYYIDQDIYLFGFLIKSKRYWKTEEYRNRNKRLKL